RSPRSAPSPRPRPEVRPSKLAHQEPGRLAPGARYDVNTTTQSRPLPLWWPVLPVHVVAGFEVSTEVRPASFTTRRASGSVLLAPRNRRSCSRSRVRSPSHAHDSLRARRRQGAPLRSDRAARGFGLDCCSARSVTELCGDGERVALAPGGDQRLRLTLTIFCLTEES